MPSDVLDPVSQTKLASGLARRQKIEAGLQEGKKADGRDFLLSKDDILRPVLKWSLKALGLYEAGLSAAREPVVRTIFAEFESLPAAFQGFRILHLSDLHIDGVPGLAERTAQIVATLPVDVCVMTGDYRFEIFGTCANVYPRMELILGAIRAEHGVLAILGNHDPAEIALELAQMGVQMLINDARELRSGGSSLWIAGVDDPYYYGCDDLGIALSDVPRSDFKVLLAHTPEMYEEAHAARINLYLCGHTHGGQIRLPKPFRGSWAAPMRNAACPHEYTYGAWNHGALRGYTSAGVGASLLPVRFNCPPEIVVIELRQATHE